LIGIGRIRAVTAYVSLAVVVNVIVSLLLAKSLGVSGVIIGTLAGYGITGPLYVRLALQELSIGARDFLRNAILPILPWAAIFAGVVALTAGMLNPASLVTVALCCVPASVIYMVAVIRFAMTAEERRALLGFVLPAKRLH
jgi:Mg2+/citrate symporter